MKLASFLTQRTYPVEAYVRDRTIQEIVVSDDKEIHRYDEMSYAAGADLQVAVHICYVLIIYHATAAVPSRPIPLLVRSDFNKCQDIICSRIISGSIRIVLLF